ncbi:MAG: recombinase family protein [Hungatella sp.]|jgi:DNA invertase Pin-like site-specific DNA recombinase|nr:recombinase family protein [Hungatella sp.]
MDTQFNEGYYADMYLRISREDGDKAESDSIANQRDLITVFLKKHPEITLCSVRADDGYTGVNYDRPAFCAMMEAVREKKVNCIIVKDFSRLGRNFTETGKYIEKIFPFLGVRFISINDDYDSIRPRTASDNLIVPVKNLMNDAYCRDISIKIRSQLDTKRRGGQCISPFAVYGYCKDPEDKNKLLIDDFAADEVRDMFKLKLDGYSAQAIADRLNERDVLSPAEYKRMMGSSYKTSFKRNSKAKWTAVAVLRILRNPVYIGTLEQGKRSTPNYKVKKQFAVPKDQWITVENAHEPIVSQETFNNVAKILRADTRTAPGEEAVFTLSGLVYCGDCGWSMIRKNNASSTKPYIYYICSGSKQKNGCTSHSIRDMFLEQTVLAAVQEYIRSVLDIKDTLEAIARLPYTGRQVKKADERLNAKRAEVETFQRYKMKLHEDYVDGILSREDYAAFGKRYDNKIREAESAILLLEQEIDRLVAGNSEEQQWISYFKEHENISELNRKLAVELIDRITIYEQQKIHIQFKFQQEYEGTLAFIKSVERIHTESSELEVV